MAGNLVIRAMTRTEVDTLVDWAAAEGWNPGLRDAELFWHTDTQAFVAAELDSELIGGGAITAYGREFGFMGFFIVQPEFRGRGLGNVLWHARRDRLLARLAPGATIGMDGVFTMQDYYAKGGFIFSHRNLRFVIERPATRRPAVNPHVLPLGSTSVTEWQAYDRRCFPASRDRFLQGWISQPDSMAVGYWQQQKLQGYGVIRRCRQGCKIGPLFADDDVVADALYNALAPHAAGAPLYLDVPDYNHAAMALVQRHGMKEVFGCARMYLGPAPAVDHERVFGITSFELG
jgi:GNAT superfamily N-acetyltransferase